ncbi:MAG: GNAT family N-acetyltransferase [Pyrinomonadaceae bacterium]
MDFSIRKAALDDLAGIERLIAASVRGLSRAHYTDEQIERSVRTVFGVDTELIRDRTYFAAGESGTGKLVGCGGWGKRKTLYGASRFSYSRDSAELDPRTDPARIRAFFIHPDFARRGIGKAILNLCEEEARAAGFRSAEMMATLPGVEFYQASGYAGEERVAVPIGDGLEIICIRMSKSLI